MKKTLIVFSWFAASIGTILCLTIFLISLNAQQTNRVVLGETNIGDNIVASSSQNTIQTLGEVKGITTSVESSDARTELLANFLSRYNSPMKPYDVYAAKLVAIADKYDIDFRLLPAISMQESNLCKVIPEGTYNCLGFGIHKNGTLGFDSYEAAFDRAGRELKAYYIDKGLVTPEQIMRKYTPSSDGSWASSVNQWMSEIRYDDRAKGLELKTNANVLEFSSSQQSTSSAR